MKTFLGKKCKSKRKFELLYGIETKVDNDVNVIAQGEAMMEQLRAQKVLVTLAIGTGIGGGIFVDGK